MLFGFGRAKAKLHRIKEKSFPFSSFTSLVRICCLGFLNECNV